MWSTEAVSARAEVRGGDRGRTAQPWLSHTCPSQGLPHWRSHLSSPFPGLQANPGSLGPRDSGRTAGRDGHLIEGVPEAQQGTPCRRLDLVATWGPGLSPTSLLLMKHLPAGSPHPVNSPGEPRWTSGGPSRPQDRGRAWPRSREEPGPEQTGPGDRRAEQAPGSASRRKDLQR